MNTRYKELAELLERNIIQGTISFKQVPAHAKDTGPGGTAKRGDAPLGAFSYSAAEGVELGLHSSASIVRSLAGLDVYLRAFCTSGDLIVIDEPEMNAHPDAQTMIVELLAMIANSGVRVVLTTHSPYIVDHLCNLMQGSRYEPDVRHRGASLLKLGREEAFIAPEMVSAYLFTEDGEVRDVMERDEATINLGTFGRTAEYIYNFIGNLSDMADPIPSRDEGPGDVV